jgi:hypothetical protein
LVATAKMTVVYFFNTPTAYHISSHWVVQKGSSVQWGRIFTFE